MFSIIACTTRAEAVTVFREMLEKRMKGQTPDKLTSEAHALRSDILFHAGHFEPETQRRVADLFSPLADEEIKRAGHKPDSDTEKHA